MAEQRPINNPYAPERQLERAGKGNMVGVDIFKSDVRPTGVPIQEAPISTPNYGESPLPIEAQYNKAQHIKDQKDYFFNIMEDPQHVYPGYPAANSPKQKIDAYIDIIQKNENVNPEYTDLHNSFEFIDSLKKDPRFEHYVYDIEESLYDLNQQQEEALETQKLIEALETQVPFGKVLYQDLENIFQKGDFISDKTELEELKSIFPKVEEYFNILRKVHPDVTYDVEDKLIRPTFKSQMEGSANPNYYKDIYRHSIFPHKESKGSIDNFKEYFKKNYGTINTETSIFEVAERLKDSDRNAYPSAQIWLKDTRPYENDVIKTIVKLWKGDKKLISDILEKEEEEEARETGAAYKSNAETRALGLTQLTTDGITKELTTQIQKILKAQGVLPKSLGTQPIERVVEGIENSNPIREFLTRYKFTDTTEPWQEILKKGLKSQMLSHFNQDVSFNPKLINELIKGIENNIEDAGGLDLYVATNTPQDTELVKIERLTKALIKDKKEAALNLQRMNEEMGQVPIFIDDFFENLDGEDLGEKLTPSKETSEEDLWDKLTPKPEEPVSDIDGEEARQHREKEEERKAQLAKKEAEIEEQQGKDSLDFSNEIQDLIADKEISDIRVEYGPENFIGPDIPDEERVKLFNKEYLDEHPILDRITKYRSKDAVVNSYVEEIINSIPDDLLPYLPDEEDLKKIVTTVISDKYDVEEIDKLLENIEKEEKDLLDRVTPKPEEPISPKEKEIDRISKLTDDELQSEITQLYYDLYKNNGITTPDFIERKKLYPKTKLEEDVDNALTLDDGYKVEDSVNKGRLKYTFEYYQERSLMLFKAKDEKNEEDIRRNEYGVQENLRDIRKYINGIKADNKKILEKEEKDLLDRVTPKPEEPEAEIEEPISNIDEEEARQHREKEERKDKIDKLKKKLAKEEAAAEEAEEARVVADESAKSLTSNIDLVARIRKDQAIAAAKNGQKVLEDAIKRAAKAATARNTTAKELEELIARDKLIEEATQSFLATVLPFVETWDEWDVKKQRVYFEEYIQPLIDEATSTPPVLTIDEFYQEFSNKYPDFKRGNPLKATAVEDIVKFAIKMLLSKKEAREEEEAALVKIQEELTKDYEALGDISEALDMVIEKQGAMFQREAEKINKANEEAGNPERITTEDVRDAVLAKVRKAIEEKDKIAAELKKKVREEEEVRKAREEAVKIAAELKKKAREEEEVRKVREEEEIRKAREEQIDKELKELKESKTSSTKKIENLEKEKNAKEKKLKLSKAEMNNLSSVDKLTENTSDSQKALTGMEHRLATQNNIPQKRREDWEKKVQEIKDRIAKNNKDISRINSLRKEILAAGSPIDKITDEITKEQSNAEEINKKITRKEREKTEEERKRLQKSLEEKIHDSSTDITIQKKQEINNTLNKIIEGKNIDAVDKNILASSKEVDIAKEIHKLSEADKKKLTSKVEAAISQEIEESKNDPDVKEIRDVIEKNEKTLEDIKNQKPFEVTAEMKEQAEQIANKGPGEVKKALQNNSIKEPLPELLKNIERWKKEVANSPYNVGGNSLSSKFSRGGGYDNDITEFTDTTNKDVDMRLSYRFPYLAGQTNANLGAGALRGLFLNLLDLRNAHRELATMGAVVPQNWPGIESTSFNKVGEEVEKLIRTIEDAGFDKRIVDIAIEPDFKKAMGKAKALGKDTSIAQSFLDKILEKAQQIDRLNKKLDELYRTYSILKPKKKNWLGILIGAIVLGGLFLAVPAIGVTLGAVLGMGTGGALTATITAGGIAGGVLAPTKYDIETKTYTSHLEVKKDIKIVEEGMGELTKEVHQLGKEGRRALINTFKK